jgi:hypothetical protein
MTRILFQDPTQLRRRKRISGRREKSDIRKIVVVSLGADPNSMRGPALGGMDAREIDAMVVVT